ncbi:MAG TPA: 30S ribosomal protein S4 [bacterium]|jgi:small subunit ribosomal protein S4|nr:30S ribosomal protein S4 [bacterium]HQG58229.1 30S ribosomal protein S4 [bacterium]HQG78766.1 30S ribosomal protein S4 [bacterium]HQK41425.1 30S ribosomal protein S4 [bacterium]
MARYIGPKCRMCRREGVKLYLKGERCDSEKCPLNTKNQAPGQHGSSRKALSEYGKQLREKQKAKRLYGVLEKQFRNYINEALRAKGVSGDILMQKLESRLDNLVYRSGFAVSRAQARQNIRRGLFTVNGKKINIPSTQVKVGDIIKPVSFEKISLREGFIMPDWLEANVKEKYVKYLRPPTEENLQEKIDVQSIIEFYSR